MIWHANLKNINIVLNYYFWKPIREKVYKGNVAIGPKHYLPHIACVFEREIGNKQYFREPSYMRTYSFKSSKCTTCDVICPRLMFPTLLLWWGGLQKQWIWHLVKKFLKSSKNEKVKVFLHSSLKVIMVVLI